MSNNLTFQPMRSLIYAHCKYEQFRHKMIHFLYGTHVPESIAQFQPYVTKYAFYNALPIPEEGDRFGAYNMQLTEHYWLINPNNPCMSKKALLEYFPPEMLVWQGTIPAPIKDTMDGEETRAQNRVADGLYPFVYAFVPIYWEEDFKGAGRTMKDGPNYRWQFMIKYPEGVSNEEGDKWLLEEVMPVLMDNPLVVRALSSKIIQEVNDFPYYRLVELWFDGPAEWHKVMVEDADKLPAPAWADKASQNKFPYVKELQEIVSIFVPDMPSSDKLNPYNGYIAMR